MADHASKCQHRDARVVRAYYDANGHHRVVHAYDYCGAPAAAVDVYGYGYCAAHHGDGDFGQHADVDLDAVLRDLLGR